MKKQLSCLMLALFAAVPAFASPISQDDQALIAKEIGQMTHALENHDVAFLVDHTYDYAVKQAGGREAFIKSAESTMTAMESKHYRVISLDPQVPTDAVDAGSYQVCVIKENLVFGVDNQTYHAESFVLGIRKKDEKDWKYLDGAGISKDPAFLKKALPSLPDSFQVPETSLTVGNGVPPKK